MRGESYFLWGVAVVLKDIEGRGYLPQIPYFDAFVCGACNNLLFIFIEVKGEDLGIMCLMGRDIGFGEGMIPEF
jgi:hypothetical protein